MLTGRLMSRVRTGPIVAAGAAAIALALAAVLLAGLHRLLGRRTGQAGGA